MRKRERKREREKRAVDGKEEEKEWGKKIKWRVEGKEKSSKHKSATFSPELLEPRGALLLSGLSFPSLSSLRSPAHLSFQSGVRGFRLREESRERERTRANSLFSPFHRLRLVERESGASERCSLISRLSSSELRHSSPRLFSLFNSPTASRQRDGPCRWAHGPGRLLGQRRGMFAIEEEESIELCSSLPSLRQARAEMRIKPTLRHPFPLSLSLHSPL